MGNIKQSDIEILKTCVENIFGQKVCYAKDCALLSNLIEEKNGAKVSETTLKRFFNLVNSNFNPSKFTLNSLSNYIGYKDYQDFLNHKTNEKFLEQSRKAWDEIKQKAKQISINNYNSITNRMGIPSQKTITRKFAVEKIDYFLNSNYTTTALIAPGGYGKSTIISNIVYDFFLCETPKYPNDIAWFLDCGVLENMVNDDFNIENFILQILGVNSGDFEEFFQDNISEPKGKIILIFDGLNEVSKNEINAQCIVNKLLKVIAQNHENKFFKIILTIRPSLWNYISRQINIYSLQKEWWYNVEFSTDQQVVNNIEPLKLNEIEEILYKNSVYSVNLMANLMNDTICQIIRIPYFLQLYISLCKTGATIISDVDLLSEFINRNITNTNNGIEKIKLINFLLYSTNYGCDLEMIEKSRLKNFINEFSVEYQELISDGILYEQKVEDKYFESKIYIKFTHQILFEFLLATYWLKEFGFSDLLFSEVSNFYNEYPNLKTQIVIWLIKYSFKENKQNTLKNVFRLINNFFDSKELDSNANYQKIINYIGSEIRKNPEERINVLKHYSNSIARKYYFKRFCDIDHLNIFFLEAIDFYLEKSKNCEDLLYGYFIKAQGAFFNLDVNEQVKWFHKIDKLELHYKDKKTYMQILALEVQNSLSTNKQISAQIIGNIKNFIKDYYSDCQNFNQEFDYKEICLVDYLYLAGKCEIVKNIAEQILKHKEFCQNNQHNIYFKILNLLYCSSLKKLESKEKALEIFNNNFSGEIIWPQCATNYWTMRYCEVASIFANKYDDKLDHLRKAIAISKTLKFPYFEKYFKLRLRHAKIENLD